MKRILPFLDDIFYWIGAGLIITGSYVVYPVAALFVAGGFFMHFAFLIGRARSRNDSI